MGSSPCKEREHATSGNSVSEYILHGYGCTPWEKVGEYGYKYDRLNGFYSKVEEDHTR